MAASVARKDRFVHSEFTIVTRAAPHLGHPGPLQLTLAVGLLVEQGEGLPAGG